MHGRQLQPRKCEGYRGAQPHRRLDIDEPAGLAHHAVDLGSKPYDRRALLNAVGVSFGMNEGSPINQASWPLLSGSGPRLGADGQWATACRATSRLQLLSPRRRSLGAVPLPPPLNPRVQQLTGPG